MTTLSTVAPDDEYPLWLITGIIFTHYLTGTMARRCSALNHENPRVFIEIRRQPLQEDAMYRLEKTGLKIS